jgi:transcriptional regulator of nitric oxide reductase
MRAIIGVSRGRSVVLAVAGLLAAVGCVITSAFGADLTIASQFFPGGESVTIGGASHSPPSAVIRDRDGRVVGYAFSTRDVVRSVGYSGRPIDIVAAVTSDGIVAGATIVAHEEPILVIGIPREALAAYVAAFRGFDVWKGSLRPVSGKANGPRVVAGASVTSAVIRDAIVRSGRAVLRARNAAAEPGDRPRLNRDSPGRASWPALVTEGSLKRLVVLRGDAAQRLGTRDPEPDKTFIDLWLALATPSVIGESLLGQRDYERELAKLGPDDDLILIAASGLYSFKGTDWRRSGVFERVEIIQADKTFRLRADDHVRVDRLHAAGTPELREIGLFRIMHATGFDPTAPFRLDLTIARDAPSPAPPPVVSLDYRIPDRYVVQPAVSAVAPEQAGGFSLQPGGRASRAEAIAAETAPAEAPLWQDAWWARRFEIAILGLMLGGLTVILIFQDAIVAHGRFYREFRIAYLVLTFGFLGLVANAQLSVVNVVTFLHALLSGFRWELFLLDPLVFLLWSFVAVSMLFLGRGVFCGWLCPFGALQELLNKLACRLGVKQIEIPFALHERLWMIKYVIFLGILAVSLNSIMTAFGLAEVEPFKTAITMKFMRDWPFVSYALALLVVSVFVERFFCRYLCPLGAALAIPARMRMFEWLKRYRECGSECQVCARRCTVQAIHPLGQINPNECIYCLQCQASYFDRDVCWHIKKREERRRPRAAVSAAAPVAMARGAGDAG